MAEDILEQLKKYETAGRVLAETERRVEEGRNPTKIEEKKEEKRENGPNQNVRRFRTLLEELTSLPATTESVVPENLKKITSIVRVLSDLTYKLESKYYTYDYRDAELDEIVQKASKEMFGKALEKLQSAWKEYCPCEEKKEEPAVAEAPKEEPTSEPEQATPDPLQSAVSQIMQIIKKNESVTSPNGDVFLVEGINGEDVRVKNTSSGKRFTVKVDIIEKWIK